MKKFIAAGFILIALIAAAVYIGARKPTICVFTSAQTPTSRLTKALNILLKTKLLSL